ncbi:hypothetical protein [Synechococcus sp. PCC 6312]|uniref:hypothetical protein n=1 Tax=Synechococcus sp. (strain ATCC 27167 / PCC 6312) TaxID=195253 RepID=UPI00029F1829|nr:hypothetical protein [Synechococcus sp. PCC 6312]AFY61889.1 hypothetical protein Syn6312_2813 [Synechococcus sp. PCC 6312]
MRRWENYLIKQGQDFNSFWKELFSERARNALIVLGLGFDPRTCTGLEAILKAGGNGKRDCLIIKCDEGSNSLTNTHTNLVESNRRTLHELLHNRGNIKFLNLQMWAAQGQRRISSRRANDIFDNLENLAGFTEVTDVIVDISALPISVYFSLIAKLLYLIDADDRENKGKSIPNLHVIVAENVSLDKRIEQQGIDADPICLHGFSGDLELEATANLPKVWFPILGEGKQTNLRRVYDFLRRPTEICPVLPSPSLDPRRGDTLMLLEYRELFFDEFRVDPRDIIYASEQNPFEAYRQIHQAVVQYNKALEVLGGCKVFISPMSSKLLCLGSLLAAYEIKHSDELDKAGCRVGIAHLESQGYQVIEIEKNTSQPELFTLWLAGECYEQ